nr:uncharacterized protein LOC128681189 isoform X1 [Plodia interpunctella]
MQFATFLLLFYPFCISIIKGVNIDIQGIINFDINANLDESTSSGNKRKDNNKYSDSSSEYSNKMTKRDLKNSRKLIKKLLNDANFRETKPYKIKEIEDLNNFTSKVLKRSLRTLKKINDHVDNRLKSKVKRLAVMYQVKFSQYLNESLDHTIRTRFGLQKFMLNTLRTSDNILQRLKNNLLYELDKSHNLGIRSNTSEYIDKHINETKYLHLQYICMNYNICNSEIRFSTYLANLAFMLTHSTNITKMKVQKSFIENILFVTDLSNIMDDTTMVSFYKILDYNETWSDDKIRDTFHTAMEILMNPTKPIESSGIETSGYIIPTIEIITILDRYMKPTDTSKVGWNNMAKIYSRWVNEKIDDTVVGDITVVIIDDILVAISYFNRDLLDYFKRQIALICQYYDVDKTFRRFRNLISDKKIYR